MDPRGQAALATHPLGLHQWNTPAVPRPMGGRLYSTREIFLFESRLTGHYHWTHLFVLFRCTNADILPLQGALLHCAACDGFLGRAEQKAEPAVGQEGEARCYLARPYIKLLSSFATGAEDQASDTFPARVAALLASACDLGAERRVELVDDGSSPSDAKAPETRVCPSPPQHDID